MKKIYNFIGSIATCVLASSAVAQDDIRDRIRDGMEQSLEAPEGIQYVTFGPLLDGRVINLNIRFHNDGGAPSVQKTSTEGLYKVDFPRHSIANAPFIEDAMIGCFMNIEACSLMTDYTETLKKASSPAHMPFFDEVYPEYSETFAKLRQEEFWSPAVLGGIQSTVLVVDAHEICHVVLKHLDDRSELPPITLEGEADGCMLHLFQITGMTPVGGLSYMVDALFREEVLGEFSYTHPAPSCRSLAFTEATIAWLNVNRQLLEKNVSNITFPSKDALNQSFSLHSDQRNSDCAAYDQAVKAGRKLAASLFNAQTNLTSNP